MKLKQYLNESKMRTSLQYVMDYMENMIDNGEMERYNKWKDFFEAAKQGAHYWSEELEQPSLSYEQEKKIDKVRSGILKLRDTKFSQEKKIFKDQQ